jgi:D-glycero-D-manno-heptose 1,7-bisphosphate phosphatase
LPGETHGSSSSLNAAGDAAVARNDGLPIDVREGDMKLVLLDRDGVINVPRKYHVKSPAELELIPGAAQAIVRLSRAGVRVAICTNQPEVARGVISRRQIDAIHEDLCQRIARQGGRLDLILCCTDDCRSAARKPGPGMLSDALRRFGARPSRTPFVGDQLEDLEAAANAHCPRVLVRSGNGRATERDGIPNNVRPVAIHDDLASFVDGYLATTANRGPTAIRQRPVCFVTSRKIRDYRRPRSQPRRAASQ